MKWWTPLLDPGLRRLMSASATAKKHLVLPSYAASRTQEFSPAPSPGPSTLPSVAAPRRVMSHIRTCLFKWEPVCPGRDRGRRR